jgi:hypothetical protein
LIESPEGFHCVGCILIELLELSEIPHIEHGCNSFWFCAKRVWRYLSGVILQNA